MTHSRAPLRDGPSARGSSVHPEPDRAKIHREALADWLSAGLALFVCDGDGLPTRRAVDDAAQRVIVVAALRQQGTISGAAETLGTSRRALRDTMKRLGLYDRWRAGGATDLADRSERHEGAAR